MPNYVYRCKACAHEFETFHGMSDRLEHCYVCKGDGTLFRVPSANFTTNVKNKNKTGQIVKDFIKDAREEIKQEKERMKEGIGE
jgi:putative FmdB family regulatory protein